jgi:hypothetical protein
MMNQLSYFFCMVGGFFCGFLAAALLRGKRSDAAAGAMQVRAAAERLVAACHDSPDAELARAANGQVAVDAQAFEGLVEALEVDRRLRSE